MKNTMQRYIVYTKDANSTIKKLLLLTYFKHIAIPFKGFLPDDVLN